MPTIRNDFFKLGDHFATIIGDDVKVGDKAPEFTSVVPGWGSVNPLQESRGKVIILCAVPSIDTETCDIETRRFNQEAATFGERVVVATVSVDLPFAQKEWCAAKGVERVLMFSDHYDMAFGDAYGTHIKELRVEQRAVFIVDEQDVVRYVEYVPEIAQHPNYEAALTALRELL